MDAAGGGAAAVLAVIAGAVPVAGGAFTGVGVFCTGGIVACWFTTGVLLVGTGTLTICC